MTIRNIFEKLANEVELKRKSLPNGYFLHYFDNEFLPKIKNLIKEIDSNKCKNQKTNLL